MRSALRLLSGAILGLLCAISVFPQASQTGGITGVVTDTGGALVQGATVDVINESTGKSERTATTSADGGFTINLLKPGSYRLEITASNFKKAVVSPVQVRIGESTRQDVTLEAGRIEETVNVEATATLINPSSAVTGNPSAQKHSGSYPWHPPISCFYFHFPRVRLANPPTFAQPVAAPPMLTSTADEPATTAFRWKESTSTISTWHTSTPCRCRIRARSKR